MVEMVTASLLYIHRFSQKSDTGLSIELLHNYIFILLDIFRNKYQNKIQVSLARLGAGFGSASADIFQTESLWSSLLCKIAR